MTEPAAPTPPPRPPPRPWQFGIGTLLVLMFLASVLSAAFSGLLGGELAGPVIVMAGPMGLMVVLAIGLALFGPKKKKGRR